MAPILPPAPNRDPKLGRTMRLSASLWEALDEISAETGHYRETVVAHLLAWAVEDYRRHQRVRQQAAVLDGSPEAKALEKEMREAEEELAKARMELDEELALHPPEFLAELRRIAEDSRRRRPPPVVAKPPKKKGASRKKRTPKK